MVTDADLDAAERRFLTEEAGRRSERILKDEDLCEAWAATERELLASLRATHLGQAAELRAVAAALQALPIVRAKIEAKVRAGVYARLERERLAA